MPAHRLTLDKTFSRDRWLLEWDCEKLTLTRETGKRGYVLPMSTAHRAFDLFDLEAQKKVRIATCDGSLTFRRNDDAARDVRELVLQGMHLDGDFREMQKRRARIVLPLGIVAFIVCGGLFALYCWWAGWAPDPPPGHWLRYLVPFIHAALLVLLAAAIVGPCVAWQSWRQLRDIRLIERMMIKQGGE